MMMMKMMIIIIIITITKIQINFLKNVLFEPVLKENESISPANQIENRSVNNLAVIIITNAQCINMSADHSKRSLSNKLNSNI